MRFYIGNLDWSITEQDLRWYFSQFGEVISVKIILHRDTGRSRGFGFVEMATDSASQAVLNLNGNSFKNRPLIVKEALPEGKENSYIKDINNFIHNSQLGDNTGISVEGRHFTITRDG